MDQTHCFTCGRDLSPRIAAIGDARLKQVFGLFPEFRAMLDRQEILHRGIVRNLIRQLKAIGVKEIMEIVSAIPQEWQVAQAARSALVEFIHRRAGFVAEHIERWIWA